MKKFYSFLLILLLLSLSGCSLYSNSNSIETEDKTIPTSCLEIINQYVVIKADVIVSEKVRTSGYYSVMADKIMLDVETTKNILWNNIQTKDQVLPDYGGTYLYGEDGEVLGIAGDLINFYTPWSNFVDSAFVWDYHAANYNLEDYSISSELPNLSKDECFRQLQNALSQYQPDVEIKYDCYTMDYETVSKNAIGTDANLYEWSEADNSYYFFIRQLCNGTSILPISSINYTNFDNYYDGKFIYGLQGFELFNLSTLYNLQYSTEKEDLISFNKIIEIFQEKMNLTIQTTPIEITTIELFSYPISAGDNIYVMHPIWMFSGTVSPDASSLMKNPYNKAIDAITGEEVIL